MTMHPVISHSQGSHSGFRPSLNSVPFHLLVMTRQQSHHRCTETYKSYQPHVFHFYPLTMWTESWPGGQPGREWTPLLPPLNKKMTRGCHVDSADDLSTSKPGPQVQHLIFYLKFIREVLEGLWKDANRKHKISEVHSRDFHSPVRSSLESPKDQQIQERPKKFNF